jgi:hypothetical protein
VLHGFRNRDIKQHLFGDLTRPTRTKVGRRQSAKVSRLIGLLKSHHLIKKVSHTHRYVHTDKERPSITAILVAQNVSTKRLAELAA